MSLLDSALQVESFLGGRIKGQSATIRFLLATLFAGGHCLLEDLPGTGKTTLAKYMAAMVSARFSRIQFTPDLMPSDITGTTIFNPLDKSFDFHPGPIFSNILLADEINRASPRAQSALLEAMEEHQVSVDGNSRLLPSPFFVIATENPAGMHGTYPLPEAQLDRFMTKLSLGSVTEDDEVSILMGKLNGSIDAPITGVVSLDDLLRIKNAVASTHVSDAVARYIAQIARFTRLHDQVAMGASTRASIALMRLSQSLAFLSGRDHVLPVDVQTAVKPCLSHRIVLKDRHAHDLADHGSVIIEAALSQVKAPT